VCSNGWWSIRVVEVCEEHTDHTRLFTARDLTLTNRLVKVYLDELGARRTADSRRRALDCVLAKTSAPLSLKDAYSMEDMMRRAAGIIPPPSTPTYSTAHIVAFLGLCHDVSFVIIGHNDVNASFSLVKMANQPLLPEGRRGCVAAVG
jgi:hypothetical protein